MQSINKLLLSCILLLYGIFSFAQTATAPAAGDGTIGNPYQIATLENLYWISQNSVHWNKYYIQTTDIDATVTSAWNSGQGFPTIAEGTDFTGSYNGNGKTISNLFMNRTQSDACALFGRLSGSSARISNLGLINLNYSFQSSTGMIGGIVGRLTSNAIIEKCYTTGSISGTGNIGGISGNSSTTSTIVRECWSSVSINATGATSRYIGGISGWVTNCTIENCYFSGSIQSASNKVIGGIAGFLNANFGASIISKSYCIADFTGATGTRGAIIGNAAVNPTVSGGVHFDNQLISLGGVGTGTLGSGSITGLTTANMKIQGSFPSWDFSTIWNMDAGINNGYPYLRPLSFTWNGTVSSDWNNTGNWQSGIVPVSGQNILFAPSASNDLHINQNITVGSVNFNNSNRKIVLGSFNLITTSLIGGNSNNYVRTNSTGTLQISIANSSAVTFPVGNSTYNPVTISNNSGAADDFSVRVRDEVLQNGTSGSAIGGQHVQRTWDISKVNPNAGSGVNFVFNWNSGEENGAMATPALWHYGTGWDKQTGTTSSTATSLTYTGYIGSFSPFAVMESSSTLPVSWLSFTAERRLNNVLLQWQTAAEQNSKDFIVQHSNNAGTWNNIGSVLANGNSTGNSNYSFTHHQAGEGNHYYRLLQRDVDGRESFSKIITVTAAGSATRMQVYPTVVTGGVVHVKLPDATTIRIYNSNGSLVLAQKGIAGVQTVQLPQSVKGTCYVRAGAETATLIIQ